MATAHCSRIHAPKTPLVGRSAAGSIGSGSALSYARCAATDQRKRALTRSLRLMPNSVALASISVGVAYLIGGCFFITSRAIVQPESLICFITAVQIACRLTRARDRYPDGTRRAAASSEDAAWRAA
jgi:hypothetical protein